MNELRQRIAAIISSNIDRDIAADLVIGLVRQSDGARGGRPRRSKAEPSMEQKPVTPNEQTGYVESANRLPDSPPLDPPSDPRSLAASDTDPLLAVRNVSDGREIASEAQPKPARKFDPQELHDFLVWYSSYPRKKAKGDAQKAWHQTKGARPATAQMLAALEWQRKEWANRPIDRIPYPATYLRAESWADLPDKKPSPPKGSAMAPPTIAPTTPPEARGWGKEDT